MVHPGVCLLLVCLAVLCVLLVGSVTWVGLERTKYKRRFENKVKELKILKSHADQLIVDLGNLTNWTQQLVGEIRNLENWTEKVSVEITNIINLTDQLIVERRNLEHQLKQLSRERDDLNWTLGVILTHDSFPVKDYCPNRICQPCLNGWIQFQRNCYLVYNLTPTMTWSQSRQYCKDQSADLVVINNLQEQMFVSNQSQFYIDQWHGYWLGLQQINSNWTWIDGHVDSLGYWIPNRYGDGGPNAQLVPKPYGLVPPVTQNWGTGSDAFLSRFICEQQALIRSAQMS